jgi:3-hydroxyacyl-CoA dehydrogenase
MELNLKPPSEVSTVAVVGSGVIGVGWILHYLRMGLDVRAYDPIEAAPGSLDGSPEDRLDLE